MVAVDHASVVVAAIAAIATISIVVVTFVASLSLLEVAAIGKTTSFALVIRVGVMQAQLASTIEVTRPQYCTR